MINYKKSGSYTEHCLIAFDNYNRDFITEDGEVIKLHDKERTRLAIDTVNIAERLAGIDDETLLSEKSKEIINKKASQTEFQKELLERYGAFYFNYYKRLSITRQYMFRFIYLCTYMNYDNLLSDGRRLYKKGDLKMLLKLSNTEYKRTEDYLIEKELISYTDKDHIKVNSQFCIKGKVNKNKNVEMTRMFDNAIRELYENSLPREHKKIALLLEILPYINYKYNIVCKNPKETNIELIEPMKMTEICEILDYDITNASKLKKSLFSLTIGNEYVIGMFEKGCGKAIYVNPRVYYKGGDNEGIKFLGDMFKIN